MLIRQTARRSSNNGARRVAANALRRLSSSSKEPESGTTSSGNLTAMSAALLAAGFGWDYSNDFRFTRAAYLYASDNIVMPLMRLLDAESAHNVSIKATAWGLSPCDATPNDPILQTQVLGLSFPNAIGLAAGYDKNAEAVNGLLDMGFGFIEIGTVTPEPQPGNDKPRMFRLVEDKAVINRCGFNNHGAAAVAERLKARAEAQQGPAKGFLGVNVGKNKWVAEDKAADDYCAAIKALAPYGDFVVVNVSSPNTPGLRLLQRREAIASLIERAADARDQVQAQTKKATLPLLVKIAPDLTAQERADIAAVALSSRVDGLIVSNTTIVRPAGLRSNFKGETGGLSGAPLRDASTAVIADMYRLTGGKVPLIGVGGVGTGQDAYDKIRAGASLVQIYSMMVYNGAGCVQRVKKELAALLRRDGYTSVAEAVGAAHREKK